MRIDDGYPQVGFYFFTFQYNDGFFFFQISHIFLKEVIFKSRKQTNETIIN